MLGSDAGHQIFERGINNVGLEGPNHEIARSVFFSVLWTEASRAEKRASAMTTKRSETSPSIGAFENDGFCVLFASAQHQTRKCILRADPEEQVFGSLIEFLDARDVARRSLRQTCGRLSTTRAPRLFSSTTSSK